MMVWEESENELVQLVNAFRKAVVAEFEANPEIQAKVLGAFTPDDLAKFDELSKAAMAKATELKEQKELNGQFSAATVSELDEIVLDMSEQHAKLSLSILGKEKLQEFVPEDKKTQEISDRYKASGRDNLAIVFGPK